MTIENFSLKDINDRLSLETKYASWWKPKLISKYKLRSLSDPEKSSRVNLIVTFDNLIKDIRRFENDFATTSLSEAFDVAKEIVGWGEAYINTIIPDIKTLAELSTIKSSDGYGSSESEEKISNKSKKKSKEKQEESLSTDDMISNAQAISKDVKYIEYIIDILNKNIKDDANLKIIKEKISLIISILEMNIPLLILTIKTDKSKTVLDITKMYDDIISKYNSILKVFSNILGRDVSSLENVYSNLSGSGIVPIKRSIVDDDRIAKIAHNVLSRWLRKKILGMKKNLYSQVRVIALDNLKNAGDMVNSLLANIESKNIPIAKILEEIYTFNTYIFKVFVQLKTFINIYYNTQANVVDKDNRAYQLKNINKNNMIKSIDNILRILGAYSHVKD